VVLALLGAQPALIEEFSEAVEEVEWTARDHAELATGLLGLPPGATDCSPYLDAACSRTLDRLRHRPQMTLLPIGRPGAEPDAVRRCIRDALDRLAARRGAARETREAMEDFAEGGDETMTWRLAQATRRRDEAARVSDALRGEAEDQTSFASYYDDLLATALAKKGSKK
jgi:DNA primase